MRPFSLYDCTSGTARLPRRNTPRFYPSNQFGKDHSSSYSLHTDSLTWHWTASLIKLTLNLGQTEAASRRKIAARLCLLSFAIAATTLFPAHAQAWQQNTAEIAALPDSPQPTAGPQAEAPNPAPASIHGTVADRDGTAYEGVRITLTRPGPAFPIQKSTTSDTAGHFEFTDLPQGPYELTIDASGFSTQKLTGKLHPGENYEVPKITLLVSTANSSVEVTASRYEIAQEELKQEEKQRVFGAIPNFYVVYAPNAPPLTTGQKFHLALRNEIDPFTFLVTGAASGIQMADGDFKGYGQGAQGFAKRYGANYADDFIGTMLGGAVFPSIFKQDPRYFYKGTGSKKSRALYAIGSAFICRGDNGRRQFNYSGILGSLAAAGISNIYYPSADREGAELTFRNTAYGIGGSAVGNLFQEFLVRKLTPKVPDYSNTKP